MLIRAPNQPDHQLQILVNVERAAKSYHQYPLKAEEMMV